MYIVLLSGGSGKIYCSNRRSMESIRTGAECDGRAGGKSWKQETWANAFVIQKISVSVSGKANRNYASQNKLYECSGSA